MMYGEHRYHYFLGIALLFWVSCATPAVGFPIPFLDMTFEAMTPDQPPETGAAAPFLIITKPTLLGGSADTQLKVVTDYTVDSVVMATNSVVYTVDTGVPAMQISSHVRDYNAPQSFQLEFDLLINVNTYANADDPNDPNGIARTREGPVFSIEFWRNATSLPIGAFVLNTDQGSVDLLAYDWIEESGPEDRAFEMTWQSFPNVWDPNSLQKRHFKLSYIATDDERVFRALIDGEQVGEIDVTFVDWIEDGFVPTPGLRHLRIEGGDVGLRDYPPEDNYLTVEFAIDNLFTSLPGCEEVYSQGANLATDLKEDCRIDLSDFARFQQGWLECADFNGCP